jgi:pilus assembly protein CpaC
MALDGREASFLAGGEFPFPVVQGGTNFSSVTIQFREFGVRLNFTPEVLDDERIRLKVAPEVSALDYANALTVSGFVVPAISTRRAETELELANGQSFAIAGLIDQRLIQVASKIPLLGDIPFIGNLFRSKSVDKNNAELLVTVTPQLVSTMSEDDLSQEIVFPEEWLPMGIPEEAAASSGSEGE